MSTLEIVRLKNPVTEQDHASGRKPHLLLFFSTGISSASTADVLIRS